MKKIFIYTFLALMCCGNVYAAIFRCEINPNHHYVIKADSRWSGM